MWMRKAGTSSKTILQIRQEKLENELEFCDILLGRGKREVPASGGGKGMDMEELQW